MRTGGLSGKNLASYIVINKELIKSFKINKIISNNFLIFTYTVKNFNIYFLIKENKFFFQDSEFKIY